MQIFVKNVCLIVLSWIYCLKNTPGIISVSRASFLKPFNNLPARVLWSNKGLWLRSLGCKFKRQIKHCCLVFHLQGNSHKKNGKHTNKAFNKEKTKALLIYSISSILMICTWSHHHLMNKNSKRKIEHTNTGLIANFRFFYTHCII